MSYFTVNAKTPAKIAKPRKIPIAIQDITFAWRGVGLNRQKKPTRTPFAIRS
jgi:hypothetical protein